MQECGLLNPLTQEGNACNRYEVRAYQVTFEPSKALISRLRKALPGAGVEICGSIVKVALAVPVNWNYNTKQNDFSSLESWWKRLEDELRACELDVAEIKRLQAAAALIHREESDKSAKRKRKPRSTRSRSCSTPFPSRSALTTSGI